MSIERIFDDHWFSRYKVLIRSGVPQGSLLGKWQSSDNFSLLAVGLGVLQRDRGYISLKNTITDSICLHLRPETTKTGIIGIISHF